MIISSRLSLNFRTYRNLFASNNSTTTTTILSKQVSTENTTVNGRVGVLTDKASDRSLSSFDFQLKILLLS